ncbi:WD repeat-containing protein on Y chromosome-like [Episyrphus balteatus]|uniref:WD repeat-containing protein on Y chromosome-like n=1 Tax=Episyrphus balteatus TaxID=286459 RepID=UPI0024858D7A|nr:WD repeat-containing protein on Y chromosome-like [Episyrphus balteatus]XP_055855759.1 WD repeat-containing protein on Y chromosome-like [Episyrphus balteatus]
MSHRFTLNDNNSEKVIRPSVSSYATRIEERPTRLHEWLRSEEIEKLHKIFRDHPQQELNNKELRAALKSFNILFTDDEFNRLFLKINQNKDYKCDWDEFVSHLIFGFQDDDPNSEKETLILPISGLPLIKKSEHRTPIVSISHLKTLEKGDEQIESKGMYLTASKEGTLRFWSSELDPIRSGISESYFLKMPTWILAIQALSDVAIICTSSTERELRFHETMASNFSLRIVIRSMPFAVYCMAYRYDKNGVRMSKLILGDSGGNVRVLEFSPILRGPFQSKPGTALVELFWSDVLNGKYPTFKPREFINIHLELIQKVYFSFKMNILLVAAEYRNTKKYRGRCPGTIAVDWKDSSQTIFRIPLGVSAFYLDETNRILATGGPDTYLRIWDPYIPSKPSAILTGHHGGIIFVFIQPLEKKVYSVDYLKTIKVWHLTEHNLLQTFSDLTQMISKTETEIAYYYDKLSRNLLIGGRKIIVLRCCPRLRMDLTDGNTHAATVSVILYNKLFRNIVTCGLDSYIIVWDPWTGRRQIMIKNCHTQMIYGELTDIEITAACFDPLEQYLLTGARDGSLKIWNYNNAVCVRNMSITLGHEITAVSWIVDRIFAVGWDRHVTEFADVEGKEYSDPKKWLKFHDDDITCADVKLGEGLVTGTYSGELIFWKLETGQPYRRYNVQNPKKFVELIYKKEEDIKEDKSEQVSQIRLSRLIRKSISMQTRTFQFDCPDDDLDLNDRSAPSEAKTTLSLSVQALLFLQSRQMSKVHGSLLVALDSGTIQVYSHHQGGGYLSEFNAVHKSGDCILAMATDKKNRYLFTGSAFGYVKVWLIQNYCIPKQEKTHVSMPKLRLQFIFLRKERFAPRPKRIVRHQPEPMLVSSYKAHVRAITSLVYVNQAKIILSGSHDFSCRLWSLGGRYLGTLGSPLPWLHLSPLDPVDENQTYRLPPDIQKVASSTTLKVLSGVYVDCIKQYQETSKMEDKYNDKDEVEDIKGQMYGKSLRHPILGNHFKLPGKSTVVQPPILDSSLSYIPVYSHLQIHDTIPIERPPTPEALKKTKELQFMEFFEGEKK